MHKLLKNLTFSSYCLLFSLLYHTLNMSMEILGFKTLKVTCQCDLKCQPREKVGVLKPGPVTGVNKEVRARTTFQT